MLEVKDDIVIHRELHIIHREQLRKEKIELLVKKKKEKERLTIETINNEVYNYIVNTMFYSLVFSFFYIINALKIELINNDNNNKESNAHNKRLKAQDVLEEMRFDDWSDSDEEWSDCDLIDSDMEEVQDEDEEEDSYNDLLNKAYIPCAAHNIQLVLEDAFKGSSELTDLINKISKNVVKRSKYSHLLAEELRNFNVKFAKKNVTRWNSTLHMCQSVIRLSPQDYKQVRSKLLMQKSAKRDQITKFDISTTERETLQELIEILLEFEKATDEFQSNKVSISLVLPNVRLLLELLNNSKKKAVYTEIFIESCITSIEKRFKLEDEIYTVSTFLGEKI